MSDEPAVVEWGWQWPDGVTVVVDRTPASNPWPTAPPQVPADSPAARLQGEPVWVRRTVSYSAWEQRP